MGQNRSERTVMSLLSARRLALTGVFILDHQPGGHPAVMHWTKPWTALTVGRLLPLLNRLGQAAIGQLHCGLAASAVPGGPSCFVVSSCLGGPGSHIISRCATAADSVVGLTICDQSSLSMVVSVVVV